MTRFALWSLWFRCWIHGEARWDDRPSRVYPRPLFVGEVLDVARPETGIRSAGESTSPALPGRCRACGVPVRLIDNRWYDRDTGRLHRCSKAA